MDMDRDKEIADLLSGSAEPLTAGAIGKALGLSRRDVNAVLYGRIGVRFKRTDEDKPRWSCIDHEGVRASDRQPQMHPVRGDEILLPTAETGPIHVDAPGGDWTVEIRAVPMSRNDPPFLVEHVGYHHRIISVSTAVAPAGWSGTDDDESLPQALVVLAACALAWEMAVDRGAASETGFPWDLATRDVLLSLAAHLKREADPVDATY